MRRLLLCVSDTVDKVAKLPETSAEDKRFLNKTERRSARHHRVCAGLDYRGGRAGARIGTMIGWRRVATTIGEKIGKKGMTYAQGMSAQVTAAVSIGVASYTGMPVSTTHILSSSVAGTMLVDGGGLQSRTIKNIAMAWVFTLPVCILLSGSLYWIALKLI